jgi:hypothetical protein
MKIRPGTFYFPPYLDLDADFLASHPGGIEVADVLFFFGLHGYKIEEGFFDWEGAHPLDIDEVSPRRDEAGNQGHYLRTSTGIELTAFFQDKNTVAISWTLAAAEERILRRRAELAEMPFKQLSDHFIADSVVALVFARDGLQIEGVIRDVRPIESP